jgi:SAM-dependent methyltransferase
MNNQQMDMTQKPGYVDINYLNLMADTLKQVKQDLFKSMCLLSGHIILDVGCGPATDTIDLAQIVGPTGHVYGIDHDPDMLAEAQRRAETAGVQKWTTHLQADAEVLPFEQETFDRIHVERVFQHLTHPDRALAEIIRVSIAPTDDHIERRLIQFYTERLRNGYIGRRIFSLMKTLGLKDVSVEPIVYHLTNYSLARRLWSLDQIVVTAQTESVISAEEGARWYFDLAQSESEGRFLGSLVGLKVIGNKQ